jgi:hypothetical protein
LRLGFTSDLHLEQNPTVCRLVATRARELAVDVLVIAGDLGGRGERLEVALGELSEAAPRVLFVPGNHDLWSRDTGASSQDAYLDVLPAVCARAGVVYLPSGPVVAAGVTFVGQTGWYDYTMRDPSLEGVVPVSAYVSGHYDKLAWSDRFLVRWPGLMAKDGKVDDPQLTAWMTERLAADLARAPRDRPAVVVTHMLAFDALAPRRGLPWGFVRGFLGSASLGDTMIAAARGGLEIRQAIAGHTHFARRTLVHAGERRFEATTRPIGYPREHKRMGFADLTTVIAQRLAVIDIAVPAHARRAA